MKVSWSSRSQRPNVSLPIRRISSRKWAGCFLDRFGSDLKLNEKQIQGVYYRLQKWLPDAIQLINRSFLDSDKQEAYKKLIVERAAGFVS